MEAARKKYWRPKPFDGLPAVKRLDLWFESGSFEQDGVWGDWARKAYVGIVLVSFCIFRLINGFNLFANGSNRLSIFPVN